MTDGEIVILGLLFSRSGHAYQLKKILGSKGLNTRAGLSSSSVYNVLKKLEIKQLALGRMETSHKSPDKKVYFITEEGKQRFLEVLKQKLAKPDSQKSSFELCLRFSNFIPGSVLIDILKIHEAELNRLIQNQLNQITWLKTSDPVERALYDRSLRLWQADKKWLKELMQMLT